MELHLMGSSEIIERSVDYANDVLADGGELRAFCYIHRTDGAVLPIPYKQHRNVPEEFQRQVITGIIRGMKKNGDFAGAVMVSEAWMSTVPVGKAALADVLRPSLDPDRQECVIISVLAFDGRGETAAFGIERSGKSAKCGARIPMDDATFEGWLFDALKEAA